MQQAETLPNPIFVMGMNGSGTTMMLDCLGSHPEIFGYSMETLVLPHFIATQAKFGDLDNTGNFKHLWDNLRRQPCFRYTNKGEAVPLPESWEALPRNIATVIDQTFLYFANRKQKQRWCEKTPQHAQHIALLHAVFPEACFIHMVRDGRSCAASFHRRWKYVPARTIYRWKNTIRAARRQSTACGAKYLEICYEELVQNPAVEMSRVCEFLEIPYTDQVLTSSRSRFHTGSQNKAIKNVPQKWPQYFTSREIAGLEQIAGQALIEFGYDSSLPEGDREPGVFALNIWLFRDYFAQGVRAVRNEFTLSKRDKWAGLSSRIVSAIKQWRMSKF